MILNLYRPTTVTIKNNKMTSKPIKILNKNLKNTNKTKTKPKHLNIT